MFKSKEAKLGYIAGFLDGEGSIIICRSRLRKGKFYEGVQLRVSITNTNVEVLLLLKQEFGGTILKRKTPKPFQRKDTYDWVVTHQKAAKFLRKIVPYLIIKKQQALLGIKLQKPKKQGVRMTQITVDRENAIREAMRILNHRGNLE